MVMDYFRAGDDALLSATQDDPEAFATFYRRHEEAMLVYMLRRTPSPEMAADLTAEVFAAALERAGRYRPTGAPAAAWLFGIARNILSASRRKARISDAARRRMGIPPLELTDESVEHLEQLAVRGLGSDALERLAGLPDDQRSAIELHILAEQDYDQIASGLQCSPGVIRQRVSRGLASLRAQLEP